jgi:hypothetical protein
MSDTPVKPFTTDEAARREKARSDRTTLMTWLLHLEAAFQSGQVLLSREPETFIWEQTGFLIRKGTELNVKIGSHGYQPIGQVDDEFFYPSQASKLVWIRDFAIATPELIKPAFECQPMRQFQIDEPENPNALNDRERDAMVSTFEALGKQIGVLAAAMAEFEALGQQIGVPAAAMAEDETNTIAEAEYQVVETIKHGAITSRMVDARIRKFAIDNPELASKDERGNVNGFDFAQKTIRPMELGKLVSEFIRLKLNDDSARRFVRSNDLVATAGGSLAEVVASVLGTLTELVPGEGKAFNADVAARALNNARIMIPALKVPLEPFADTTDISGALTVAIATLQGIQAGTVTPVTAPAIEVPPVEPPAAPVDTGATPAPTGEAAPLDPSAPAQ